MSLPDFSVTPHQAQKTRCITYSARDLLPYYEAARDWWASGEHRYGERAATVKSEEWDGPAFGTCMNAASVCRKFETSRRHEVVSFRCTKRLPP